MKKRVHIFYSGRVQGVGFRFTAEGLAREAGIQGWVKNLRDGRVELVAEAGQAVLNDYMAAIKKTMGYYISDMDVEWSDATGEFNDFEVAFYSK